MNNVSAVAAVPTAVDVLSAFGVSYLPGVLSVVGVPAFAAAVIRFVTCLVAAGRLAAVRGGRSAGVGVPKGGVLPRAGRGRGCGGSGGGLLGGLGRPQLVATL